MSQQSGSERFHSHERMRQLKAAALPTREENPAPPDEVSRRGVLKAFMGASSALALGVAGCERKPRRQIVSRVAGPEYLKPGTPLYYSSTWTDGSFPYGLMIKTVDGRPIKVEGNPDHPINAGSSSAAMQASLLSLYDPDRLRGPRQGDAEVSWADADARIVAALREAKSVVLMTRSTLGPTERELVAKFVTACPGAKHVVHEAVHDGPRRSTWRQMYGGEGEWLPRLDRAKVVVSLDCDFLGVDGVELENVRRFAASRQPNDADHAHAELPRYYVIESAMTVTGSNADHRIALRPSAMGELARALREAIDGNDETLAALAEVHHLNGELLQALAADLRDHRGEAVVLAGGHLPASVHGAVALLNDDLGAAGKTLEWNPLPATLPVTDPAEVAATLAAGVDVLICLGVNPVYDWPGGGFDPLLSKAGLSVGHGPYADETLSVCDLALPSSHNFESWNDADPRTGVESVCQPVIAPLFDSRQEAESLLRWTQGLADENNPIREVEDYHAFVKARQSAWEDFLRVGVREQGSEPKLPELNREAAESLAAAEIEAGEYEVVILPDRAVYDGRFANSAWLQELPDPVSKLVWDNAATMSEATAAKLGVAEGDMVSVGVGNRAVELPALIEPGTADGVVKVTLGYGRTAGGRVVKEAGGVNVAPLMGQADAAAPRVATSAAVKKAAGSRKLVRTQKKFSMEDRPIVLDGTLDEFRAEADFVKHKHHVPELISMYKPVDYSKGHKWAMAIDLSRCVGCSGCMTACQAENNIPVVGREECGKGRDMSWLRIDRYVEGEGDDTVVHHEPMLCQQCDDAPCENVCPVNATVHSPEGLNEMVYNRCVGTRYCSNNCPYKVRRFNWYRYQARRLEDPVQELAFNPQVTVRGVGVMEKCTFCVQRINAAKFGAADEGEPVADGAVRTACQQACPAEAIQFGDLNDPDSAISKLRASPRGFHVLEELNVKPNVTYLARVRNPNPATASGDHDEKEGHHG